DFEYAAAWSALVLSAVYLTLAKAVFGQRGEAVRLLAEAFLALGVVFGSLAIPLALEGRWTSAAWALEGAAIVWVGVRQQRLPARIFGIALQFFAAAAFVADSSGFTGWLVANSVYLGCLFLALGGLFCAWYLDRHRAAITEPERIAAAVLFAWGIGWWVGGALVEIDRHVPYRYHTQTALVFLTASCVAFSWLHTRIDWRLARYPAPAVTPLMVVALGERGAGKASARPSRVRRLAARVRRALPAPAAPRDPGKPLSVLGARRGHVGPRRARKLGSRLGDQPARRRARCLADHCVGTGAG